MPHLDNDAALLRAADLHYGPPIDDDNDLITISTRTLRNITNTKFNKAANRPGRSGYSDHVRAKIQAEYYAGHSIHRIARDNNMCDATIKRWVTSPS